MISVRRLFGLVLAATLALSIVTVAQSAWSAEETYIWYPTNTHLCDGVFIHDCTPSAVVHFELPADVDDPITITVDDAVHSPIAANYRIALSGDGVTEPVWFCGSAPSVTVPDDASAIVVDVATHWYSDDEICHDPDPWTCSTIGAPSYPCDRPCDPLSLSPLCRTAVGYCWFVFGHDPCHHVLPGQATTGTVRVATT